MEDRLVEWNPKLIMRQLINRVCIYHEESY